MEISCPISSERINENIVRIIALCVAVTAIVSLVFSNYWPIVLLLVDFAMRAFTTGKFSLLRFIGLKISKSLQLRNKLTDLAPKKFAATLGFGFCLLITTLFFLGFNQLAYIFTLVMIIFALLESLLSICVGCYVYTFLQKIKRINTYQ